MAGNANEIANGHNERMGTGKHHPTVTNDRFNNPNSALYFDESDFILIPTTSILNDTFSVSAGVTVSNYPLFPTEQDFISSVMSSPILHLESGMIILEQAFFSMAIQQVKNFNC